MAYGYDYIKIFMIVQFMNTIILEQIGLFYEIKNLKLLYPE